MRLLKGGLFLLCTMAAGMASASPSPGINWWHFGSEYKDAPALGWLTITFLIFVYGLVHVIKKPLSLYLETRSKDIRRQIDEGIQARAESEEKLRFYEEKLQSLSAEIERMKTAFNEQAQAEKKERERLTKVSEARILRDTDNTIRANFERSKHRLAEEMVGEALAIAEGTILPKRRDEIDEFLRRSLIKDLGAFAEEAR